MIPYHNLEESGIYEQLSVDTDTQSLSQGAPYHQHQNTLLMSGNYVGLYGSLPHQVGPGSLHGSSHSLLNVYATHHGNPQHMAPVFQQPFPFYMTRNGTLNPISTNTCTPNNGRRRQSYVPQPLEVPNRSPSFFVDPKNMSGMKEQWVDFGPSPSENMCCKKGHSWALFDRTNGLNQNSSGNKQNMNTSRNRQQPARSNALLGGLLPMKSTLPAIEEDLCDCSISESDNKTRSYKSCRSATSGKTCQERVAPAAEFPSQEDGNTDYLSVSNSDSLERITPLSDIAQSLEVIKKKYCYFRSLTVTFVREN